MAGAASEVAESRKHLSHGPKCQELGGGSCIPLTVETFGNWSKEVPLAFSRLASYLGIHMGVLLL